MAHNNSDVVEVLRRQCTIGTAESSPAELVLALQNSIFIVVTSYRGREACGTHLGDSWVVAVGGNRHATAWLLAQMGRNGPGLAQTGVARCLKN
jgi:hypothetical protein